MYYQLNPKIALRTWWRVPSAYIIKNEPFALPLSVGDFERLKQCDSLHDIPEGPEMTALVQKGMVRGVEKGQREMTPWQYRSIDNRYFPRMNWMITSRCNYNCRHCFNAADNTPLVSEWTFEEAEALLDEARDCGIHAITLTGGEPMKHPDFFRILEAIVKRDMFVEELNTNGSFLDQCALDRMAALGCRPLMKISFDGLGHHDWLRNRKGAEAEAINAIKGCIKKGFRVKVQTNVHRQNIGTLLQTAEFLDTLGVEAMRIIRTSESPRWKANAGDACLSFTEYYDAMNDFAAAYIQKPRQMAVNLWQYMDIQPKTHSFACRAVSCKEDAYRGSLPVCPGNRGMVAVAADGEVYPCHQLSGCYIARNWHLGNVKKGGLQPLLQQGAYLKTVCATVADLKSQNPKCGNCPYFKYCVGGCRALALALTDNVMGEDPAKCLFFNNGYYEKVLKIMSGWRNIAPMNIN
jgi:radical SAM protein with 4Fe4S-binding SPASM domain